MPRQKARHVDDPAECGRRLREARERAGLSQRALAFPGCTPAYISRIEAGERTASLQLLRELGRRVGVSADYLATGTDESRTSELLVDAEVALRLDDFEEAERLYSDVLHEAADDRTRAAALEGLGHTAYRTGRLSRAVRLFEESTAALDGDPCNRPTLAEVLARSYAGLGDLRRAIDLFERCLERFRTEKDRVNQVRFACLLGYALTDAGRFEDAERVLAEGLEAGRTVKDPVTRARLYWSQSRLRGEEGQIELAARYAQQALETLRTSEDTYFLAHAHELLASLYNDLGRSSDALDLLREARSMLVEMATPIEVAHFTIEEARALAALGETETAAALARSAIEGLGDAQQGDAGRAYVLLAEIFVKLEDPAEALELYEQGIRLLETQPPSRYLVAAYRSFADLLRAEGRADEAILKLKHALATQEQLALPSSVVSAP